MPGYWLRLRGGRKSKYIIPSMGEVRQLHSPRSKAYPGSDNLLAQMKYGSAAQWTWLTLSSYIVDPNGIQAIATANDSNWSLTNPAAVCNLYDRPMFYNGLGVRGASSSTPPFSTYYSSVLRYCGLDAFCPSGSRPTVAFTAGTGHNVVGTRVRISVGLYNSGTDHYSNAVYVGQIDGTEEVTGTITVSNLTNLKSVYLNSTEQGELYYVFYATFDGAGYTVPYLILDSGLTGPLKAAISASTASLSVTGSYTNGWALDVTKEAPYNNHPPRPMRSIAFVNGRVYGIPMTGGSGSAVGMPSIFDPTTIRSDFTYQPSVKDQCGVAWSNASNDSYAQAHPGDPLQCWPTTNHSSCPNGDAPIIVAPSQDGQRVFVGTPLAVYYLTESADGIHEWYTISEVHGIINPLTFVTTRYGQAWIDQRNQLVLLPKGSTEIQALSLNYQNLISTSVLWCDYQYNPLNEIDRIEIALSNGTTVIHDFAIGGEAYTCTNKDFTAGKTVTTAAGVQHHILAKNAFYTQEAQPDDGTIPTQDTTYAQVADAAISASSAVLTSATAAFTSADASRTIVVMGAGVAGAALNTSILTVDSATQVTLTAAASTTVTAAVAIFGTGRATDINGEYHRNWTDFGDSTNRKQLDHVAVIADAEISATLGDLPLQVEAYYDFEEVAAANTKQANIKKSEQSATDSLFQAVLANANARWLKLVYKIRGHAADSASFLTHGHPGTQGDLAKNFYGSIVKMLFQFKQGVNRP
jgi:hypothetical protein